MGRNVTSLELRRSGAFARRLAVTGEPPGMSTRAPLPTTCLMSVKDCGGIGLTALRVRSDSWMRVRAPMLFLATTTLAPLAAEEKSMGRLATPAAAAKARTARIEPTMMYVRPRPGRPTSADTFYRHGAVKWNLHGAHHERSARSRGPHEIDDFVGIK